MLADLQLLTRVESAVIGHCMTCLSGAIVAEGLIQDVEHCLGEQLHAPTRILETHRIPSPHLLLRCRLDGPAGSPKSVIVKQVTTTEFTSGAGGVSPRLLNEWAGLQFLSSLPDIGVAPRLIAAGQHAEFVVIEDLGSHPQVIDVVNGADYAAAAESVAAIGTALGRMHAAARSRLEVFQSIQKDLGITSPRSDSTKRVLDQADIIARSCSMLGVDLTAAFWDELASMEAAILDPGLFHTFIHGDAGPQNCLWADGTVRLVDFEFGAVGHGLLDVVSARLGFPHSEEAASVPMPVVADLEDRYRRELCAVDARFEDDDAFSAALVDACAHWAFSRWGGLWSRLFEPALDGGTQLETAAHLAQSQAMSVFRGFLSAAEQVGSRATLAQTLQSAVTALSQRLPDLQPMRPYRAFTA